MRSLAAGMDQHPTGMDSRGHKERADEMTNVDIERLSELTPTEFATYHKAFVDERRRILALLAGVDAENVTAPAKADGRGRRPKDASDFPRTRAEQMAEANQPEMAEAE